MIDFCKLSLLYNAVFFFFCLKLCLFSWCYITKKKKKLDNYKDGEKKTKLSPSHVS